MNLSRKGRRGADTAAHLTSAEWAFDTTRAELRGDASAMGAAENSQYPMLSQKRHSVFHRGRCGF